MGIRAKVTSYNVITGLSLACLTAVVSCARSDKSKETSESLNWINKEQSIKTNVTYLQDPKIKGGDFNVTPILQSTFYEEWISAMRLLRMEIAQFGDKTDKAHLEVDSVNFIEKRRLELQAGGGINLLGGESLNKKSSSNESGGSNEFDDTGSIFAPPPIVSEPEETGGDKDSVRATSGQGISIALFLDGDVSEFSSYVRFNDLNDSRRLEFPLSERVSLWKVAIKTDAKARIDAPAIFALLTKVPAAVSDALGSILKSIGSVDLFLKVKSTEDWIPLAKKSANIQGLGNVSKLSYLIAKDLFTQVCKYEGFDEEMCKPKIIKWKGAPVTEQLQKHLIMPIVKCEKTKVSLNTTPIYNHYMVAPAVEEEELDFFATDPNQTEVRLHTYISNGENIWNKEFSMPLFGGNYGTFVEKVSATKCGLDETASERCMKVRFGAFGYQGKCDAVNQGTFGKKYGYSLLNEKRVFTTGQSANH